MMETILELPVWSSLVRSLLHGLWQGAVIFLALAAVLRILPAARANLRYAISCGALLLLVVAWLATWSWLENGGASSAAEFPAGTGVVAGDSPQGKPGAEHAPAEASPGGPFPVAPAADGSAGTVPWNGYAAAVWVAGVLFFQTRLILAVTGARALVRDGRPIRGGPAAEAFGAMLDRFGLSGRVALIESEGVRVPAVLGWLKPVVLVPPAFFSGMSPEQVEAIVAHELAHIRRHDFAVNLAQKVIEGMLFFNPFVWMIGRLIRREREACCDATAVRVCGRPEVYAAALAFVAGKIDRRAPAPAMMALGRGRGELLDRVRRILQPGRGTSSFRLSISGAGGFSLVCLLVLGMLKVTVDTTIAAISPAERLERFAELRREYPSLLRFHTEEETREVEVKGVARTADGGSIPERGALHVSVHTPAGVSSYSVRMEPDGNFSFRVPAGEMRIEPRVAGYAHSVIGPINVDEEMEALAIGLERGHRAEIRFVDPEGNGVPGVSVQPWSAATGMGMDRRTADHRGVLELEDLGDIELTFDARADGFQDGRRERVRLGENEVLTWELEPAEVVRGTLVFADTGDPISGARIHLAFRGPPISYLHGAPTESNLVTQADDLGRFELSTMRTGAPHYFTIVADGAARSVAGPIRAGDDDLHLGLPRERFLTVRVVNVSEEDLDRRGRLRLDYAPRLRFGQTSHTSSESFHATPENGEAEFRVGPLWLVEGQISVGEWQMNLDGRREDVDTYPVEVDLREVAQAAEPVTERSTRPVKVVLRVPAGLPSPGGFLVVREFDEGGVLEERPVELVDGRARFEVAIINGESGSIHLQPDDVVGYWFPRRSIRIAEGRDSFIEEIPVLPAGAIHGRVLGADGEPAPEVLISVVAAEPVPGTESTHLGIDVKNSTSATDTETRFLAGPLPIGGTYYVCAHRESTYAVAGPIVLTDEEPFAEAVLIMPEGVDVVATILRPDGSPFIGKEAGLAYNIVPSHSFTRRELWPDRDGRIVIPNVNPDAPGHYTLTLKSNRDYQPEVRRITPGQPETIHLRAGNVIEGRVVETGTGMGIAGIEVYALPRDLEVARQWGASWFDPERPTDEAGSFRFSNLPHGEFNIHVRGARLPDGPARSISGSGQAVVLQAERR